MTEHARTVDVRIMVESPKDDLSGFHGACLPEHLKETVKNCYGMQHLRFSLGFYHAEEPSSHLQVFLLINDRRSTPDASQKSACRDMIKRVFRAHELPADVHLFEFFPTQQQADAA